MTLYDAISVRRQVRQYSPEPLDPHILSSILAFAQKAEQMEGQWVKLRLAAAGEAEGGPAPHYLFSWCEATAAAYANAGYVLQKADLHLQSLGLGSGWFMSVKPREGRGNFCIALAFGRTGTPLRRGPEEFKRLPLRAISDGDGPAARAVRLAPSSLNSQPWQLSFEPGRLILHDRGRDFRRFILKNKLNRIDLGIAARHAVLALEQEGKHTLSVIPKMEGENFTIEITYG